MGEDGPIAGARDEPGRGGPSWPRKLAILAGAFLIAVVAFAVSLLLAILVTGLLTDPSKPHSQSVVVAELVVVLELVWFVAAFSIAWKLLAAQSGWKLPRFWTLTGGILLAVLVAGLTLFAFSPPDAVEDDFDPVRRVTEREANRAEDIVVVLDPASAIGQRAVALARTELGAEQPDELVRWNSAFAIFAAEPPAGEGDARFRNVAALGDDRRTVLENLGSIIVPPGASETGPLPRVVADAAGQLSVDNRENPNRHVVLLLDRLPPLDLLDRAARRRLPATVGGAPLTLIADAAEPNVVEQWRRRGVNVQLAADLPQDSILEAAEAAAIERTGPRERDLARMFRPVLLFDADEVYVPLDIDSFLAETVEEAPAHQVCTSVDWAPDDCHGVATSRDLFVESTHLDIAGGLRGGADLRPEQGALAGPRQRIYYRLSNEGARSHLDYWWFFRFNSSPVAGRFTCLSGLAIRNLTCFDHEGDWEGLTVTLDRRSGEPLSVTYSGHGKPHTYEWSKLESNESLQGTHPLAYVAYGSHASYPRPCGQNELIGGDCRQTGSDLPDGRRNGQKPWPLNGDERCLEADCLLPLPATAVEVPALWNAYGGYWGADDCTVLGGLCVKGNGPRAPAYQRRYQDPAEFAEEG